MTSPVSRVDDERITASAQESPPGTSRRLPDFIIAGAMKCGTTSLRHILSQHPSIFVPDFEAFYFDVDDIGQHPELFSHENGRWLYHDVEGRYDLYLEWYASLFASARSDQIVGENSTTYLASSKAPERIAKLLPNARLIVMLRDPTSRAYSHYWHFVRTGRVSVTFEESVRAGLGNIVHRSCYLHQIQHLLRSIPRHRVHFVVFEKFVKEPATTVGDTLRFLGLSPDLSNIDVKARRNIGKYPRSVVVELTRNWLLGRTPAKVAAHHLPQIGLPFERSGPARRALLRTFRRFNPRNTQRAPQMREETRRFLDDYFRLENRGIGDLIGHDIEEIWGSRHS